MQTTIKNVISLVGTGLHSGRPVRMQIFPASAEYGIWFRRIDIHDRDNLISARYDNVTDTRLCTHLSNDAGADISTVEHLMAALIGCGIHNALIEVDGPEVPIMDGSSDRFVRELLSVGVQKLNAPVRVIRILEKVEIEAGGVKVSIEPCDNLEIEFSIDFPDAAIGQQSKSLNMANGAFVRELRDSRTFCRKADVDWMLSQGLGLGGNLENALVVDGDQVLTPGGMRHADECVRHKMLDALGDLALAGAPIIGRYSGVRAGHAATNALLRKLFANPMAYEMVTCDAETSNKLPGVGVIRTDVIRVA
ncbi:MAG: UDP-3-O-acyl-N-acetylglucosamine deacetylase [Alphaproteobacteria bacterium]|nr:UDP-3-O-acyl-N-acetylglucosamine deacetylase [Alphaproteobacteria bacterium]